MGHEMVVIGAGGHAKVVIATARAAGFEVVALYDDNSILHGTDLVGVPIIGSIDAMVGDDRPCILAIGNNHIRQKIAERLCGNHWVSIIHPYSVVDDSVSIGEGTVIFAGVVIQPGCIVGKHAILNTRSSIDHDCKIGDYAHLAPGVSLAGDVEIGEGTMIGIGSSIIPQLKVGCWSVVGAGAAVTQHIENWVLVVGVPAKVKKGFTHEV